MVADIIDILRGEKVEGNVPQISNTSFAHT